MRIRWQLSAVSDLATIRDYIARENPAAGLAVTNRVLRAVDRLEQFPKSGRPGRTSGTREVVLPNLPYIIVYTHDDIAVDIIAVFHGRQDRTP